MTARYPVKKINVLTCCERYENGVSIDVDYVDTADQLNLEHGSHTRVALCLHGAPGMLYYVHES